MNRGFCGIGIYNPCKQKNLGTLWRSAHSFGADFLFTIGARYENQHSDTTKATRHIPYWPFTYWEDFIGVVPVGAVLVGVELTPSSRPLETYTHPERAIYILGQEDGSLPSKVLSHCRDVVQFSTVFCLNVASAGTVVLYDRQVKRGRHQQEGGNQ